MSQRAPIRAVVFDAYGTLFDVHSVGLLAEQLFPERGAALSQLWRTKQLEYSWQRSLAGRYKPFWELTEDALVFAAEKLGLTLSDAARAQLMQQYACLTPFPENLGALRALKRRGIPLAILSNGTPAMLDIAIKSAGLAGIFDHVLSVDAVGHYKTAPQAYQMGPHALGLPAGQILFVSANGWDVAGAAWFGYTTFWINRDSQPTEVLDVKPHHVGTRLTEVAELLVPVAV